MFKRMVLILTEGIKLGQKSLSHDYSGPMDKFNLFTVNIELSVENCRL